MKNNDFYTITFRLPIQTLSKLTDVTDLLRKERNLLTHPSRQELIEEAVNDFINKHMQN